MALRKQIAFSQDCLTALGVGDKETFSNLTRFQPSPSLGLGIEILGLQFASRASLAKAIQAGNRNTVSVEVQVSDSALFGEQENILASLYLPISQAMGPNVGDGATATRDNNDTLNYGTFVTTLLQIPMPGAIYLHCEMWHLEGNAALVAGDIKTAAQVILYYNYLPRRV